VTAGKMRSRLTIAAQIWACAGLAKSRHDRSVHSHQCSHASTSSDNSLDDY
jgi:hypothetical protein